MGFFWPEIYTLEVHSVEKGRSLDIDGIKQLLDKGLEEKIVLLLLVKNEVKWLQIYNHRSITYLVNLFAVLIYLTNESTHDVRHDIL